jgi:hypothetical protein
LATGIEALRCLVHCIFTLLLRNPTTLPTESGKLVKTDPRRLWSGQTGSHRLLRDRSAGDSALQHDKRTWKTQASSSDSARSNDRKAPVTHA